MVIYHNSITTVIVNGKIITINALINYTCIIIAIATIQISYMTNANIVTIFIEGTTAFIFIVQSISFVVLNIIPSRTIL